MSWLITSDLKDRFWSHVDKRGPNECWNWLAYSKDGYGYFRVSAKVWSVHRFSFYITNGFLPSGRLTVVMHHCENSLCVNPNHLRCGTQKENNSYPGRLKKAIGWKHTNEAKKKIGAASVGNKYARQLSDSTIAGIYAATDTQAVIAKQFGVSQALVSMIKNKQRNSSVTNHVLAAD